MHTAASAPHDERVLAIDLPDKPRGWLARDPSAVVAFDRNDALAVRVTLFILRRGERPAAATADAVGPTLTVTRVDGSAPPETVAIPEGGPWRGRPTRHAEIAVPWSSESQFDLRAVMAVKPDGAYDVSASWQADDRTPALSTPAVRFFIGAVTLEQARTAARAEPRAKSEVRLTVDPIASDAKPHRLTATLTNATTRPIVLTVQREPETGRTRVPADEPYVVMHAADVFKPGGWRPAAGGWCGNGWAGLTVPVGKQVRLVLLAMPAGDICRARVGWSYAGAARPLGTQEEAVSEPVETPVAVRAR